MNNENKKRTSNIRYIIIYIIGIFLIACSIVLYILKFIGSPLMTGISLVGGIFVIVSNLANEKYKKNQEILNYLNAGMYINQETKIHRRIGTPKANQDNKDFDTWSEYILKKVYIPNTPNYKKELYKCLLRERRDCQTNSEIMKTIVLPSELGLITVFNDSLPSAFNLVSACLLTLFVIILIVSEVSDSENRKAFIDDFIEVIDIYEKDNKEAEEKEVESVISNK